MLNFFYHVLAWYREINEQVYTDIFYVATLVPEFINVSRRRSFPFNHVFVDVFYASPGELVGGARTAASVRIY